MKQFTLLVCLVFLAALLSGCSSSNSEAPGVNEAHSAGWLYFHGGEANSDLSSCQVCHGLDFTGSGQAVSCLNCHLEGPPFGTHPLSWLNLSLDHQSFPSDFSWTGCATAACHGATLQGGTIGSSCLNISAQCHVNTAGDPPASHVLPYIDSTLHGIDGKDNLVYCRNCHGRPLNDFSGGYVADLFPGVLPEINVNGDCSSCHPDAIAHTTNWTLNSNAGGLIHGTAGNKQTTCVICHNLTSSTPPAPFPGAPSCFSVDFTNANSIASDCHPHSWDDTYRASAAHGPDANRDQTDCQRCHATPPSGGPDPQFTDDIIQDKSTSPWPARDITATGCMKCHNSGTAHPSNPDVTDTENVRWYDAAPDNFNVTHGNAGNSNAATITQVCGQCHSGLGSTGTVGFACTFCHVFNPAGDAVGTCNSCHDSPPAGNSVPNRAGEHTLGDHRLACGVCHTNAGPDGSAVAANHFTFPVGGNPNFSQADLRTVPNTRSQSMTIDQTPSNVNCNGTCHGEIHSSESWY